jgi:hypothetical protein
VGLIEELNRPIDYRRKCRFGNALDRLNDEERQRVMEICDKIMDGTGEYTASWLARTLRESGVSANHQSILRHSRKECCCGSE